MRTKNWAALGAAALLALTLAGCGGSGGSTETADDSGSGTASEPIGKDTIAPVTMSANELQGARVELVVGQVLNINTDSLAVDSYTGEVADPEIAEFTPGRVGDSAEFNPGVTALSPGSTEVTMTNEQGGIQPLTFTVEVTARD
ncbi:hypothetical protein H490_0105075 [Leucobacter sp. UCD-THU]|jgi:hypothetical protein|uniref:pilus assembly protein N-terminal domain-containing protein n=1 Tax=Leucobacter sp. UCD-THU TaxID=1292023 RepID=UPI00037CECEC|nr:pilus assembly protein N-terminal domain-containing protein [Leucobacter sp. UCD-THU]EYT55975.1 hypothetical protein H490_0105075 [Leucobacter sp. UCD-THU]